MSRRIISPLVFTFVAWLTLAPPARAAGRVELELVTESNFPASAQQQWYQLLTELKVDNLRIRKAISGDKAEISVTGTQSSPVYRVTGILKSNNELIVPGGRFSSRDRGRLAEWLKKLREEGPESTTGSREKQPFGMSPTQYAAVSSDLSRKVDFSTAGMQLHQAIEKIAGNLQLALSIDKSAAEGLRTAEAIREDLLGISSGTALAYVLRSAGLVLEPRLDARKQPEYVITHTGPNRTPWPVGWPTDKPARELLPALFEQLNVEIEDTPLSETLTAIGGRLKTPVLYDHYALARLGIDPDKTNIKLAPARLAYAIILRKALHQADLKGEWRVDDNGQPLLWVTTLKPVK